MNLGFFKVKKEDRGPLLDASVIGLHMVTCTFAGVAIGYYLDKWLDTKPIFLFIFLVAGIIAGFKNVYIDSKRIMAGLEESEKYPEKPKEKKDTDKDKESDD